MATVLIVDDEPDILLLVRISFELAGHEVRTAADGEEALASVHEQRPGSGQDEVRGGIEGAIRHFAKPVAPDALIDAVEEVLAGAPEPVRRKAVQQHSLERLARMESGGMAPPAGEPRPRLSRLERPRGRGTSPTSPLLAHAPDAELTDKQRALLRALQAAPSVSDAAAGLGMSRSNIYASLRRVGRKLEVSDVSELLRRLRAGDLASTFDG